MADDLRSPHPSIRPSLEHLRQLPTLSVRAPETDGENIQEHCRASGTDYRLELKLETEDYRFWLCTRSVGEPFTGWRDDAVLMENVKPDEDGLLQMSPYGADDLKLLQKIDYLNLLRNELLRLLDEESRGPFSWVRKTRIQELREEMGSLIPKPDNRKEG